MVWQQFPIIGELAEIFLFHWQLPWQQWGVLMGYTVAMVTTYGSEMVKTS